MDQNKGGWVCPLCNKKLKPRGTAYAHMSAFHPRADQFSVVCTCYLCGAQEEFHGESMKTLKQNAKKWTCAKCKGE